MISTLYLDMDGVIADMEGRLEALAGGPQDPNTVHERYLYWRREIGPLNLFTNILPLNQEAWLPFLLELEELGVTTEILTSTGTTDGGFGDQAHWGKVAFLKQHYGDLLESGLISHMHVVARSRYKALYANPNPLLLDDYEKNVTSFRENGGHAVLYDHRTHTFCLDQVKSLIVGSQHAV